MSYEILYLPIKHLHISLALVSLCFFCVRFYWSYAEDAHLNKKWVKIIPHCVDSALLLCGVYLMFVAKLWPNEQAWLLTKLIALLMYIILGSLAIKYSKSQRMKALTGSAAVFIYIFMVNVAISHHPLIFLRF